MLSDLRIAIKKRFDQEGIEFPYPHRTITYKEKNDSIADRDVYKRQRNDLVILCVL